jgi:hypothetical protein
LRKRTLGLIITLTVVLAIAGVGIWWVVTNISKPIIPMESAPFVNLPFPDQDRDPEHIAQIIGLPKYDELINSAVLRRSEADSEYWQGNPCMEIKISHVSGPFKTYTVSWVSALLDGNIVEINPTDKIITIENEDDQYSFYVTENTDISASIVYEKSHTVREWQPGDSTVEIKRILFEDLMIGDSLSFADVRINPDRTYALGIQTMVFKYID